MPPRVPAAVLFSVLLVSGTLSHAAPPGAPKARLARPNLYAGLDLENSIERAVGVMRRRGELSRDEKTAWAVFDLTAGKPLVSINTDDRLQAASMIKPFFALAFFHQVRSGELVYGPKSRRMMTRMMQYSDNEAANWILARAGGPRAAQKIISRHYRDSFPGVRIVEYIPPGGRTYRNKASARDYARLLRALWENRVPGSWETKRLMGLPSGDRIARGVPSIPSGTRVLNKTGSTRHLCGDMGIIVARGRDGRAYPYALVGLIQKKRPARDYSSWIRSRGAVIRRVSDLVYERMRRRYGLRAGDQSDRPLMSKVADAR